jgi:hypothetical protein
LGDLRVFRIICGNPDNVNCWSELEYPTPPKHPPNTVVISANWSGYTATLRLNPDGSLTLVEYLFVTYYRKTGDGPLDFETSRVVQDVNERIPGDFWLVCSPAFGEPQTYIPFRDGRIVLDQSEWKHQSLD